MNLLKHHGLELPVFDQERPLLVSKSQFKQAANDPDNPHETFLRAVFTTGPGEQSLKERLDATNNELDRLSQFCGTSIVKHTFGLYPIEDPKYEYLHQHKVPDDYVLAAEVEILQVQELKLKPLSIRKGIYEYRKHGGQLGDVRLRQFAYGKSKFEASDKPEWTFVDIEPRLKKPSMRSFLPN